MTPMTGLLSLVFRMASGAPHGARWRTDRETLDEIAREAGITGPGYPQTLLGIPVELSDVPCLRLVVTA